MAAAFNLTLAGFEWATERLVAGQSKSTGFIPDDVDAAGIGHFNSPSAQYCTFPAGSPLPRPSCCDHNNCTAGSMDNAPFVVFNVLYLVEAVAAERGTDAAADLLAAKLPALLRGLETVPTGPAGSNLEALAYNDPSSPMVGYGFEDTVVKTGALNFASLLVLEAAATLCQAVRRHGVRSAAVAAYASAANDLCTRARAISAALTPALWDNIVGMFRPATGLEGNLTDVWGSAYAASLDGVHTFLDGSSNTPGTGLEIDEAGGEGRWPADVPPPTTAAQRTRIAAFVADPTHGVLAAGQVRHLPIGQGWVQSWCVPANATGPGASGGPKCARGWNYNPGGYQDGGFWATPVHHVWPLLHRDPATRSVACGLVRDFVGSVKQVAIGGDMMRALNEWVDVHGRPHGAAGYVASVSNAAAAAKVMAAQGGCPAPYWYNESHRAT